MNWTPGGFQAGESVEVYAQDGEGLRYSGEPRRWARLTTTLTADSEGRISFQLNPSSPEHLTASALAYGLTTKRSSWVTTPKP
jgi:hypothetical protein